MRFGLCAPLLVASLIACALAPRKEQVGQLQSHLPSSWSAEVSDGDSLWWTGFGDESLPGLVVEALDHNYDLQAAGARLHAAAAQARLAGAPKWPQVEVSGSGSRRRQNFIGFPIPGGGDVLGTTSTNYGVSLNVSWEVDLWGRLRAGETAALADLASAEASFRGARLSLISQTARAYFAVVEAYRQVELAQASRANQKFAAGQIRVRYEAGLRPSLDLRLGRSSLAATEATLELRRRQLDQVTRQLETLLGRYPAAELETAAELPSPVEPVPAGLPADLLARRPDLVAAERQLAAASARVDEARRALYPRLSLTGSGGSASADLVDLLDGDFAVWSLVANLSQPLLQGGRLRAGVELAESNRDRAVAAFASSVLSALAEVETRLAADLFIAGQERALRTAAAEAAAAHELAEQRYVQGLSDVLALLEAQRRAYDAESQLLAARRQRLDNRIDLHLALGGDFGH